MVYVLRCHIYLLTICGIFSRTFINLNQYVCKQTTQNTFCALQAVARHVKLESKCLKDCNRALNGMDQEKWLLLALNLVEWHQCGTVVVD